MYKFFRYSLMKIVKTEELNKLALLIFEKTGLVNSIKAIKDDAEHEIECEYGNMDSDDDDEESSNSTNGGVAYHSYLAIVDDELSYDLAKNLNEQQKRLLFRLIEDRNFVIFINRCQYSSNQSWNFSFFVPTVLNNPESKTFQIDYSIDVEIYNSDYELKAETFSDISEDEITKTLTLYSLQL